MGQLEDFLQGKPLNDALAALKDGEDPDRKKGPQAVEEGANPKSKRQRLNNDDREWLRRLTLEPGWNILMWLLDSAIEQREESAKLLSQQDPVNHQAEIITAWTYTAAFKEVARLMRDRIRAEIQFLQLQQGSDEENGEVLGK